MVSHGLASFSHHDDQPFRVIGVLAKTGTPVDRTVIVSLEAITAIHVDWGSGARRPGAGTPEEAIRAMDLGRFDVVVTDLDMPTVDGRMVLEATKRKLPEAIRGVLSPSRRERAKEKVRAVAFLGV